MVHPCYVQVVCDKLVNTAANAFILTMDPDRIFLRKVDREIVHSQSGHGAAYYAQLQKEKIGNLETFIAKGDYKAKVEFDRYNIDLCDCPRFANYDEHAKKTDKSCFAARKRSKPYAGSRLPDAYAQNAEFMKSTFFSNIFIAWEKMRRSSWSKNPRT